MNIELNLSANTIARYAKLTLAALMLAGAALLLWFLQKNFYEPLTQATLLTELNTNVISIRIEEDALTRVLSIQSNRLAPLPVGWDKAPNPFAGIVASAGAQPFTNSPPELR